MRVRRLQAILALSAVTIALLTGNAPASAHHGGGIVHLYNPITDGDADHNDVSARWPSGWDASPPGHHIVYANWGWLNDWSMDIVAGAPGRTIVTPFGTRTTAGHPVTSTVVGIAPGCPSGNLADGGYRVTVEARNTVTGEILARAELVHVAEPQVSVGQRLGAWTPIGFTSQFRYSSCYRVVDDSGIHVHFEVINMHRYTCWRRHSYGAPLTELSIIGAAATHCGNPRARC
jgi:hypothetical protein